MELFGLSCSSNHTNETDRRNQMNQAPRHALPNVELSELAVILVLRFAVRRLGIEAAHANQERYGTKNHVGH